MELQMQSFNTFSFIFTFLIFLLILIKQWKKSKTHDSNTPLPPGPRKLPLIGNFHQLHGQPHHSLRDLAKKYGPLMHLKLGEVSTVIVSSPKVAQQIMKTHDLMFVDRPIDLASKIMSYKGSGVIRGQYGDRWRQLRKICVIELLSAKRVQSFWALREEEVLKVVEEISSMSGSSINLSKMILTMTNDITGRATFGKTCKEKEAFLSIMKEVMELLSGFGITDLYPSLKFLEVVTGTKQRLEKMHKKVDKILEDIIREHKENRMTINTNKDREVEEDLVDVLLRLQEGRNDFELPITMDNVKSVTLDMFAAGTDTSLTAIIWAFSELLRSPKDMEKAQAEVRKVFHGKKNIKEEDINELKYLDLVVKEAMRLHTPLPLLVPRQCRERCEIDGYEIPKGTKVIINAWAIARDPENWSDPESFIPERFQDLSIDYKGNNYEFIPFGAGRRICPGIAFGMANVMVPLALLLCHFDWKLANGVKPEELDMTEAFSAIVGREHDLYVIPTPYKPLL